ncbi:MAG: hypothetical protein Q9173_002036 [Seirophora scorigena]
MFATPAIEVPKCLTLIVAASGFSLVYAILLLVYRLFFHPLAHFPGPKIAAATKWYEFYMDIGKGQGGQFKWEIDRMHREYGPIVRINPDEIHIDDPSWFGVLNAGPSSVLLPSTVTKIATDMSQKRNRYPPAAKMLGITGATFSTIPHDMHRMRRSAISSYFSKPSIADLEPFIHKRVELLCDALRSQSRTGPVDVHALFLAYANDTVCAYSFDYSMNLLEDSEMASSWKLTIKAIASVTPLIKQFPWIIPVVRRIPGWFLRTLLPKLGRLLSLQERMNLEATKAIQTHQNGIEAEKSELNGVMTTTEQKPRFLQQILESNLASSEKTAERMGQEAFSIIAAGGETVARTLTTLTYHLISNPPILAFHELEQLPWLTAVIKESMRLWGVMASRSPLVSPTPLQYKNWVIPAGTPIGMTMMNVLHNPTIYPSPHTFDPSRWLELSPNSPENQNFVCYGKGSRMCLGMNLAQTELYLAVAAVFRRFDLELYDTERLRDVETTRDCFTGEASKGSRGVRVRVVAEP